MLKPILDHIGIFLVIGFMLAFGLASIYLDMKNRQGSEGLKKSPSPYIVIATALIMFIIAYILCYFAI